MLQETLFNIDSLEPLTENEYCASVSVDFSCSVFDGHFPGNPILPGVCTLLIIKSIVGRILGAEVFYRSIASCKFTSLVVPQDGSLSIRLSFKQDAIAATVSQNNTLKLKLKAKIGEV